MKAMLLHSFAYIICYLKTQTSQYRLPNHGRGLCHSAITMGIAIWLNWVNGWHDINIKTVSFIQISKLPKLFSEQVDLIKQEHVYIQVELFYVSYWTQEWLKYIKDVSFYYYSLLDFNTISADSGLRNIHRL